MRKRSGEEPARPRREAPDSASAGGSEKPRMGVVTGPEPESAFLPVHGSLHVTAGSVRKLHWVEYAEAKHTVRLLWLSSIQNLQKYTAVGRAGFLNYSAQGLLATLSATVTSQPGFFFLI